jgi:hypothetical protein
LGELDEVRGQTWQLVIAVHDEGDGLILCEWWSSGCYNNNHSYHVGVGFVGLEWWVSLKWSFLCNLNLIYVYASKSSKGNWEMRLLP